MNEVMVKQFTLEPSLYVSGYCQIRDTAGAPVLSIRPQKDAEAICRTINAVQDAALITGRLGAEQAKQADTKQTILTIKKLMVWIESHCGTEKCIGDFPTAMMSEAQGVLMTIANDLGEQQKPPMSKRSDELLSMAADAFAEQRNPFDTDSLVKHKVTLDECGDLSDQIATVLRGYLAAPRHIQLRVLAAYATHDTGISAEHVIAEMDKNDLIKKLKK